MWRRIPNKVRQPLIPVRKMHTNMSPTPPTPPSPQDWFNFILSSTNCVIIMSVLWGFESYNQKMALIEDTNDRITELCIAYRKLERHCAPLNRQITKDTVNPNFLQKR